MVTGDTKITKGKETPKFEDLNAAMNVSVEYNKDGDKNMTVAVKVAEAKKEQR
jgi:hypothetical protein